MSDNRNFDISGDSKNQLLKTMECLLAGDKEGEEGKVNGFVYDEEKGLILMSYGDDMNKFPVPLGAKALTDIVWDWLQTDEAKAVKHTGNDINMPHDGHNEIGWRVYVEAWSRVGDRWGSIVAVKPKYLWYGK